METIFGLFVVAFIRYVIGRERVDGRTRARTRVEQGL
jgi:hypothetical protein